MKITIAGCGKIGKTIIDLLSNEGHSITVIDKQRSIVNDIVNLYDVGAVEGNATSIETLREANTAKCDIFISVCENDETNFVSCALAKALGAKKTIARARDTDYASQGDTMRDIFSIDMMINPEHAVAKDLFDRLRFPVAGEVSSFEMGKAVSVELKVHENSKIVGKTISNFMSENDLKVVIGAIYRDDNLIIPNGDTEIQEDDLISVISNPENVDDFLEAMGMRSEKARSVFIVGGSRIAYHLTNLLTEEGVDVKIIEEKPERCRYLAEKLDSKVEIVQADGTNELILAEEGIDSYDACLSLTGYDEENILISLYAKTTGVPTVITKLTNDRLDEILDKLELGKKVSPKQVTVNQVLYFIRSIRAKEENTIEKLRKTMNGKLEILQFDVNDDADFVGKAIKDLKIRSGVLIACVIRGNKVIVANGNLEIDGDDKIIIMTKSSGLKSLDSILR